MVLYCHCFPSWHFWLYLSFSHWRILQQVPSCSQPFWFFQVQEQEGESPNHDSWALLVKGALRCWTLLLPIEQRCDASQMKAMVPREVVRHCEEDSATMDEVGIREEVVGEEAQEVDRHDIQEEEGAAEAHADSIHNVVMEDSLNDVEVGGEADGRDEEDRRDSRPLVHNAFGKSPLSHAGPTATMREGCYVSSFPSLTLTKQ